MRPAFFSPLARRGLGAALVFTGICAGPDAAAPLPVSAPLNCVRVDSLALARDPMLADKALEVDKAREKLRDIDMGAILPKFEVSTGVGPAPGLRDVNDTTSLHVYSTGDPVTQIQKEYDFSEWGPFFGVEGDVAQPLNVARYRAGRKAGEYQIKVSEADFQKERLDVSQQAQTLYYQRLLALTLHSALVSAQHDLDQAEKKLARQLDSGAEGVTQTDLLQLKAGRFALDQGLNEAALGLQRTALGLRFLLAWPDSACPPLDDSVLTPRTETIPPLDSLKFYALRDHPDLKRLQNGLGARQELLKVAQGELGPDIFLFGNFRYTKAWSSDRESSSNNPFATDPLNQITAVGGLGLRIQLNFWERYQNYRKARLELRQLQRTEVYAAKGILVKVEEAYDKMQKARADMADAQDALRAADGWLKGAAMKYDLDPSSSKDLIAPFRQSLTSKRDFYQAVFDYNVAVADLFQAVGWTLQDYFHSLQTGGAQAANKE